MRSSDKNILQIKINDDLAIITIVGNRIHHSISIRSKIPRILEKSGIITKLWDQDSTTYCLILLLDKEDGAKAIKKIHDNMIMREPFISLNTQPLLEQQPVI